MDTRGGRGEKEFRTFLKANDKDPAQKVHTCSKATWK